MEDSWGKRAISRSDCVPLPTPGAPTSMILAAFFSFLEAVAKVIINGQDGEYIGEWCRAGDGCAQARWSGTHHVEREDEGRMDE